MPETIGQQLTAAREERGLTIQDIAHQTRIHLDVVCQLEADDYSHFPNLMFAKSFLQLYSHHIEVDASPLIDELAEAAAKNHDEQFLLGGINPDVRETYGSFSSRIPMRPIIASAAAVVVLGISATYLVNQLYANHATSRAAADPNKTAISDPPVDAASPQPAADVPDTVKVPEVVPRGLVSVPTEKIIPKTIPRPIPRVAQKDEAETEPEIPRAIPVSVSEPKAKEKPVVIDEPGEPSPDPDERALDPNALAKKPVPSPTPLEEED